jgi:pyruvate dehydrogenase (quinone)
MLIFHELSKQLPGDAIVSADSGSAADWYARHLRFSDGVRGSLSGTLATMGAAVPYAIGAKFAHPDRPSIALVGDGAMQMNNMAELITAKHYMREWSDPRLVVAVLHNNDLNQVTWEMRAMGGAPKFEESQRLPDIDYAGFAAGIGLGAETVTDPGEMSDAWKRALAADRPYVLDIHCDPNVPPIPPHTTFEEAKALALALAKGDTGRWGIMKEGLKVKAQEVLPHRGRD